MKNCLVTFTDQIHIYVWTKFETKVYLAQKAKQHIMCVRKDFLDLSPLGTLKAENLKA